MTRSAKQKAEYLKGVLEAEALTLKEMGLTEFPPEMQMPVYEERPIVASVLISEAARRLGISRQAIHRLISRGKLRAEKVRSQWYVDGPSLTAAERHCKEKPDLGLQALCREETHPGVERSWEYDPFEERG